MSISLGVGPFLVIMIGTIIYQNVLMDRAKADIFKIRKKQLKNNNSNFRVKFKTYADRKVSFGKREKIEILCAGAGLSIEYSDYLLMCIGIASLLFILLGILMGNVFLGGIFAVVGFIAPKEVLGLIKKKRLDKLERQIGPCMNMIIKRYEYSSNFETALIETAKEFEGTEPLYTELTKTVSEIQTSLPITEALDNLARRTQNKYLGLLSDYYAIAYKLGTDEVRKKLLGQAYVQYEENRKMKALLANEISEPVRDNYMMVAAVPLFFLFGCYSIPNYFDFMMHETMGQIGLAICSGALLGIIIFINKVIGAPIEKPVVRKSHIQEDIDDDDEDEDSKKKKKEDN